MKVCSFSKTSDIRFEAEATEGKFSEILWTVTRAASIASRSAARDARLPRRIFRRSVRPLMSNSRKG